MAHFSPLVIEDCFIILSKYSFFLKMLTSIDLYLLKTFSSCSLYLLVQLLRKSPNIFIDTYNGTGSILSSKSSFPFHASRVVMVNSQLSKRLYWIIFSCWGLQCFSIGHYTLARHYFYISQLQIQIGLFWPGFGVLNVL